MSLRVWLGGLVAAVTVLAGCGSDGPPPPKRTAMLPNPVAGTQLYGDGDTQAHRLLETAKKGSPERRALEVIVSRPTATWLTGGTYDELSAQRVTANAAAANKIAVLVFYNQPNRDACSGSSAGGAKDKAEFLQWNRRMIAAMQGTKSAVVVFAPDALAEIAGNCLEGEPAHDRVAMFAQAVRALMEAPQVAMTCIDAGHPGWIDTNALGPLLKLLDEVGADETGCISLNVSNAYPNEANAAYVRAINGYGAMPPVAALVDTSRNGGDTPPDGKWCNVPGRKLGVAPTTTTGVPEVYAYAYIKRPGQSDGDGQGCNPGDLPAGEFDLKQAVSLARDEID